MYRLVIVAGPNRGSAYSLIEGENSIGRQMDNHIVLTSSKVSKRHCALLVTKNEVFLKDESSTNGTFVNGALTRKQPLKPGDKLGLGDFVMELIQVGAPMQVAALPMSLHDHAEMKPVASSLPHSMGLANAAAAPVMQVPNDLPGKLNFIFEGKIMPQFYGMLMKTEWRMIVGVMFGALVAVAVVGSIMPIVDLAEKSVQREAMIRAKVLAREVADRFLPAIANHAEAQIDLSVLENEESIKLVAITNPDLQIIAPQSRLNQLLAGGREAGYVMRMAKEFKEGRERGAGGLVDESTAIFVEPIKTTDARQVKTQVSAIAVVAIDFSGNMLQTGGLGVAYGIGFVVAGIMGVLIYFIFMRLTLKPFEVLNDDLDQVLRGELPKVTHEFKIADLDSLWNNINSMLQRMPKGGSSDHAAQQGVVDWDHEVAPARALAEASGFGLMAFDSNMNVVSMNQQFEEISGIHMNVLGQSLQQVARDQAFVMLVNDLKDRVQGSPSRSVLDEFEFSGVSYQVVAVGVGPVMGSGLVLSFKRKE